MEIRTKRVYEDPAPDDGSRVLVDRLWPRGVSKEEAELDDWLREIAPSDDLRRWFDHDPERWNAFVRRYAEELREKEDLLDDLVAGAEEGRVTLLYAARDTEHNNAIALKQILEAREG